MSYKNSTPALPILLADFIKLFSSIADFGEDQLGHIIIILVIYIIINRCVPIYSLRFFLFFFSWQEVTFNKCIPINRHSSPCWYHPTHNDIFLKS
ncbi:MAG TPA: hypothetical protein HPP56_06815, partial [Nitrospirae bacterium]|nr:hypothetical protein [Nitrospirota bacterium]